MSTFETLRPMKPGEEQCYRMGLIDGQARSWIDVSRALPTTDERVLVVSRTKKGIQSINLAYYSNGVWHGQGSMAGVTHWMFLPAFPDQMAISCGNCDFWREADSRCMCEDSQWAGDYTPLENYCSKFEPIYDHPEVTT